MHLDPALVAARCLDADAALFDAVTWEEAQPALAYCSQCRVQQQCERQVLGSRPRRSWYDGVAGGRVWKDGAPVPRPRQWKHPRFRDTCGTKAGLRDHVAREEWYCAVCEHYLRPLYVQGSLYD